ncbi:Acid-sensing ion channel 1C-like, partial [Homarus americanus]
MGRRIMWGTTLVVSLLVLVAVMGYQMNYFLSYPVNVDVQVIHSTSLRFPAVTICPYPRNNMMTMGRSPLAVREAYQQVVGEEYPGLRNASRELENLLNTKDLWDATAWNVSAMIHECYQGRGVLCNETGAFTLIYTLFGPCLTFRGAPTTLAGSYHGLYVKLG